MCAEAAACRGRLGREKHTLYDWVCRQVGVGAVRWGHFEQLICTGRGQTLFGEVFGSKWCLCISIALHSQSVIHVDANHARRLQLSAAVLSGSLNSSYDGFSTLMENSRISKLKLIVAIETVVQGGWQGGMNVACTQQGNFGLFKLKMARWSVCSFIGQQDAHCAIVQIEWCQPAISPPFLLGFDAKIMSVHPGGCRMHLLDSMCQFN